MEADANRGRQRIHAHCWVDWNRQGIWRDRRFIALPFRTFRMLAYMVQHSERVVTQNELSAIGWGEARTIWDLQAHIHRIRTAIESDPHHPRWLVTRRGGGYLLHTDHASHHG